MKRRILASLLAILMVVGLLPPPTLANTSSPSLTVSQTATNLNDEYISEVTMTFPSAEYSNPMDIVFVLDGSTSTDKSSLAEKAAAMLKELASEESLEINAGLVIFGGTTPILYESDSLVDLSDSDKLKALTTAMTDKSYNGMTGRSGSNLQAGIETARELLKTGTAGSEGKYMILLTDGGARMWYEDEQSVAKCYGGTSAVYFNTNQDFTDRYKIEDSWQETRSFDDVIKQSEDIVRQYSIKYSELNNAVDISPYLHDENYYTNLEAATYFAAQSLKDVKDNSEANVIWVDYPYNTGTGFGEYTESFKSWLDEEGYITRYDSDSITDPFAQVKDQLIYYVSEGSVVENVIGYGIDNDGNNYDFEMVNLDEMTLKVGGTAYTATYIDQNKYGFGTRDDNSGKYPFELTYYPAGKAGNSDECFELTVNTSVAAADQVSLIYQVELTDPQQDGGTYGVYDKDGSKNKGSLLVSKCATLTPKSSSGTVGTPVKFPLPTVSYSNELVNVNIMPMTVYVGGDGYEGVVSNSNGDVAGVGENTLPEPGYTIDLPEAVDEALKEQLGVSSDSTLDLSGHLIFTYDDGEGTTREWRIERYDQNDGNDSMVNGRYLYKLVTTEDGQPAVRIQFTSEDKIMISDNFTIDQDNPNQTYTMTIHAGPLNQSLVKAEIPELGMSFYIEQTSAELKIRGVVSGAEDPTTDIVNNAPTEPVAEMTAQVPEGTKYYYKNSEDEASGIQVADGSAVSLLVDEVLSSATAELEQNAVSTFSNVLPDKYNIEMRYLDLVYTKNSNAVVAASEPVTVYWPYPEGTDQNTEFYIVHYDGLNRNDDQALTDNYTMDLYSANSQGQYKLENTDQGIKITVDSFSPFALIWGEEDTYVPPVIVPGGDDTPDLNTTDHFSYIVGYPEDYRTGEPTEDEDLWPVKPQGNITRAEVATIFYRLLKDEVREENWTQSNSYSDVGADDWFNTPVSTLGAMGIVVGYEDGSFRPNEPITRAEFAAIAVRFFEEDSAIYEEGTFSDIAGGEWFADAVQAAKEHGIIGGYPDGSFQPNEYITRAEACSIVNRTLDRIPHEDHLLPVAEMNNWPDNLEGAWYYADMQEATNGHEYEWITDNGKTVEEWTSELPEIDWAEVERELCELHGVPYEG